MQFVARCISYAMLSVVSLLLAGLVYVVFGVLGGWLALKLFSLVNYLALQSPDVMPFFGAGGALVGGGCGLILLARQWISLAQQCDDPTLRNFANYLDETRRAMRPKR